MSEKPWVYEMVIALLDWSDEHPVLFVQLPDDQFVRADGCGCAALDHVPADVRAQARVLRDYLAAKAVQ